MIVTDNPLHDFYEHDAEEVEWLKTRPVCARCEEPIQDDYGYLYGGILFCSDCWDKFVNQHFRVDIDDYIENERGD